MRRGPDSKEQSEKFVACQNHRVVSAFWDLSLKPYIREFWRNVAGLIVEFD
jgi:hypothetical protein